MSARFQSTTFQPDDLQIRTTAPVRTKKYTLAAGEARFRGAALGVILGTAVAVAVAGNTGNGTMSAVTVGAGSVPGAYRLTCIEPSGNGGTFEIESPTGNVIGRANVGVAFTGALNFTLSDGSTDFAAGDAFLVTVAEGTVVKLAVAAATDGSSVPRVVLAEDCDAAAGARECLVYTAVEVNGRALTLGAGHTIDTVREPLRRAGIYVHDTLPA